MLNIALSYIVNELNNYLPSLDGSPQVVMGNIAFMENEEQSEFLRNRVVVSLVNIEEETTLKNGKNFQQEGLKTKYVNRPVYLNLYILISANYLGSAQMYGQVLSSLSTVIEYFQNHKVISHLNSGIIDDDDDMEELELSMELFALSFEQVNYVWGSLGGKQVPSVLYKGRLVAIKADSAIGEGGVIKQIIIEDEV